MRPSDDRDWNSADVPLVPDALRPRQRRPLGARRVGVRLPGRMGRLGEDLGHAKDNAVMPAHWVPSPAAGRRSGQVTERYPVPRYRFDQARLRPILDRLRQLNAQARTVELIRITAWQGHQMLGTRLSTAHTALAVVTDCPAGTTHLALEGCGDFFSGNTWLPGYERIPTAEALTGHPLLGVVL
jgi:hypothetical protein